MLMSFFSHNDCRELGRTRERRMLVMQGMNKDRLLSNLLNQHQLRVIPAIPFPFPALTMAGSIIENVKLFLPWELRSEIYSLTFAVDFEKFERLRWLPNNKRNQFQDANLLNRAAFSQEAKYQEYRRRQRVKGADAKWPEYAEEAFFQGSDLPTTRTIYAWNTDDGFGSLRRDHPS